MVLLLAIIKSRLIIRYFMEVRDAPRWLRHSTDAWLAVLFAAIFVIYLITDLLAGVARQIGELADELPGPGASLQLPSGLPDALDLTIRIGVGAGGVGGGRGAQRPAVGLHQLSGESGAGPAPLRGRR